MFLISALSKSIYLLCCYQATLLACSIFIISQRSQDMTQDFFWLNGIELQLELVDLVNSHLYAHLENGSVWGALSTFLCFQFSFTFIQCYSLGSNFLVGRVLHIVFIEFFAFHYSFLHIFSDQDLLFLQFALIKKIIIGNTLNNESRQ